VYEQPQMPGYGAPGTTAVAVTARYWWMSFLLGLFKPFLAINGHPVQAAWGRTVVPMPPGQHHVHMHIPYLLPSRIGNADTVVTVHPGQVVELEYRAPAIAWLDGAIGAPPQNHNGKTAAIVLVALPLVVLLLCLCGGIGISLFSDSSSDDDVTLPAPVRTFPTAEPFEPAPTSEAPDPDKPALRDVPSRTLIGPVFESGEKTYTMDFSGWPFAFRTPGSWGCLRGKVDLPEAKAYVCIDEGNPGSGQKVQIMVRPCPAPCGTAERTKLTTEWFDPGAKGKVYDERTSFVETPKDAKGRYTLDMSHFFGTGESQWQVGVGAFTPPAGKANVQKIFNDVLTQSG
jgi:hypothetical protein